MKTLFLGLGNPILGDDGVGIRVVEEIERIIGNNSEFEFLTRNLNCLHILDFILGYDRVIIVDAIQRGTEAGTLYPIPLKELEFSVQYTTPHTINLITALKLGNLYAENMPEHIAVYGIEVRDTDMFSEKLSEELEKVVPQIAREILKREGIEIQK